MDKTWARGDTRVETPPFNMQIVQTPRMQEFYAPSGIPEPAWLEGNTLEPSSLPVVELHVNDMDVLDWFISEPVSIRYQGEIVSENAIKHVKIIAYMQISVTYGLVFI